MVSYDLKIDEMQFDYIDKGDKDFLPFFDFVLPIEESQYRNIYKINPVFEHDELKSLTLRMKLNGTIRKGLLVEKIKLRNSVEIREPSANGMYKENDITKTKKRMLYAKKTGYSWWNVYQNIKLLISLKALGKNQPEGLMEITILRFKDYEGFLEDYKMKGSKGFYGYNFVLGNSWYNILLFGFANKTDVLNFVQQIQIVGDSMEKYNQMITKYRDSDASYRELYLLSAISLMPENRSLSEEWNRQWGEINKKETTGSPCYKPSKDNLR